ncbi:N utilization substance protein B [Companilactobacillus sp. RD055328]|uniref:transcription antitermination factor NusB n=1 Tax=Companilactobacillus sp. RD055328 TaxID=2916634 RepID=UPI001FC8BB97|nr:transcription antitermination factor NusB [Companilactobacillus sp. RD055328]GKQ42552.1 N utilization substance protein B [Companilactobacillus sp. RD055328]
MEVTRHEIRELALQTLYSMGSNNDLSEQESIQNVLEYKLKTDELTEAIPEYLEFLVNGVNQSQKGLDEKIAPKLGKKWTIDRLPKMSLVILRLGLFEILYSNEVPQKVAINEAIELAHQYSDPDDASFINAVLSNFIDDKNAG